MRIGSTNRTATKEELSRLFHLAGIIHFDLSPVEGTEEKDLDLLKVNDYWSNCYDIDFTDGLGRGIPMIIKEMKERAIFEEIGELFCVTFLFRQD